MVNSESDSDDNYSPLVDNLADKFLSSKPIFEKRSKSRRKLSELKSKFEQNKAETPKKSARIDSKKKIEDYLKDLQQDFLRLAQKFESLYEIIPGIIESMEFLEDRVAGLEDKLCELQSKPSPSQVQVAPTPYRDALFTNDSERLDKLEYLNSENDRKKRSLEVSLTDPSIDISENLMQKVENIFSNRLKMTRREIDANLNVRKARRENTVIVTFSQSRFKNFVFKARKRLREKNEPVTGLFLNDNLTSYNHKILMELKRKRKNYSQVNDPFSSIYSYDGRVFVKMKNASNTESINIKNLVQMKKFIDDVGTDAALDAAAPAAPSSR